MGLEQTVTVPAGAALPWPALAERLAARGFAVRIQMIDGLPAFPDEEPPADWRELRIGTLAGTVTLQWRDPAEPGTPAGVGVVVWDNADPDLRRVADAVLRAVADVTGSRVETPDGP
jgi:hypothetical protein